MLIIPNLILTVVIVAGAAVLEWLTARFESLLPGLILPSLSFIFSVITVFGIYFTEDDTVWHIVGTILSTFLISNIPTILLLAIFFICRASRKKKKEIEKMKKQDLD